MGNQKHTDQIIVNIKFPPGFSELGHQEVANILNTSWHPAVADRIKRQGTFWKLNPTQLHELIFRLRTAEDVEIMLLRDKCFNKSDLNSLLTKVSWRELFLEDVDLQITAKSYSSTLFHEGAIVQTANMFFEKSGYAVLNNKKKAEQNAAKAVPDNPQEFRTLQKIRLYVEDNKLHIFVSLTNAKLSQRGYKQLTHALAPIREEQAANLANMLFAISQNHQSVSTPNTMSTKVFVPFCGTGTLGFEAYLSFFGASLHQAIDFSKQPTTAWPFFNLKWFKKSTWEFLQKKHKEEITKVFATKKIHIFFSDKSSISKNITEQNIEQFKNLQQSTNLWPQEAWASLFSCKKQDFLKTSPTEFFADAVSNETSPSTHFILLNPPYGKRLMHVQTGLYKKICQQLALLGGYQSLHNRQCCGFILCGTQEDWVEFTNTAKKLCNIKVLQTKHFMQGGADIRACFFKLGLAK